MKKYKILIFDLDHTLWDCDRNARETLEELYHTYDLKAQGVAGPEHLEQAFHEANHTLWLGFEAGKITRKEVITRRFPRMFEFLGLDPQAAHPKLGPAYEDICNLKPHLKPFAQEVLAYLYEKYPLYILSNGPREQHLKIQSSRIDHFFQEVFTSAELSHQKPHPEIFRYMLQKIQARAEECLMIGDSLRADIAGAQAVGMDSVWYKDTEERPEPLPTYHIKSLRELSRLL